MSDDRRPISSKFSSSADGRLQKLPSLPLVGSQQARREEASRPSNRSTSGQSNPLAEGGAVQGVDVRTRVGLRANVDAIGDALLVSHQQPKGKKFQSLTDESDLAAGRRVTRVTN